MFKVMHVQESFGTSMEKTEFVADSLESSKLKKTASCARDGVVETLTYMHFPMEHWRRIRTHNAIERFTVRSGGARVWWEPFPTASRR